MIPAFSVRILPAPERLTVDIEPQSQDAPLDFACYLMRDGEVVSRMHYQRRNRFTFEIDGGRVAEYRAIGYARHRATHEKKSVLSETLVHPRVPDTASRAGSAAQPGARHGIRLKGWPPLTDRWIEPAPDYLEASDNLEAKPYRVRTDGNGFIVSGREPDPAQARPWVFLGGSFVESTFCSESRRLVAQLESRAQADLPGVRMLNGGYSGATTLHLVNVLVNRVIPVNPAVVCFAVPSNDSRFVVQREGYWNDDRHLSPFSPVWQPRQAARLDSQVQLANLLRVARACCEAWQIKFVLMTTPHRSADLAHDAWLRKRYPSAATYERTRQLRWDVARTARRFCQETGTMLLDLEQLLRDFQPLSYDDLHLNESGADQVAPLVYLHLRQLLAVEDAGGVARAAGEGVLA